jgi:iron complex transport system substrate-binding protein
METTMTTRTLPGSTQFTGQTLINDLPQYTSMSRTSVTHTYVEDVTRRALLVSTFVAALAIACGDDAADEEASDAAGDAFPVTIEHKYGVATIPKAPVRIVSVGFRDHEHLLSLGVKPIGVRDWYGSQPYATWPWARAALGDAQPEVLPTIELDFEQIAALQPDLIIGIYSGMTPEEYATLSKVAPTVAQSGAFVDWGMPWQEELRTIGRAVGRSQRAEELVAEVEARFAKARTEHPAFVGATAAMAQLDTPGQYFVLSPQDHKARFLTSLGFVIPQEIADAVGGQSNRAISDERLHLLDRDVLVWLVGTWDDESAKTAALSAIDVNAVYEHLDVVREGRDIFLGAAADALAWSTPLSLTFAIDESVPLLDAALRRRS